MVLAALMEYYEEIIYYADLLYYYSMRSAASQ